MLPQTLTEPCFLQPTFTFVKGGKVEAVLMGADRSQLKHNIEALRSS